MERLSLKFYFTLTTAFHTAGNRWRWGADKALSRSSDGVYVIPATTMKGALRDRAEVLLHTWGQKVCNGPTPNTMCPDPNHLCIVCQVFGHPRFPAPLRFQDVRFELDTMTQIRSGVSISRQRRAALPGRLFFIETTSPGLLEATAICEGYFPDQTSAMQACALVILAARSMSGIGGGRTRGMGWLEIEKTRIEATVNSLPVSQQHLEMLWSQWSGGQNVAED